MNGRSFQVEGPKSLKKGVELKKHGMILDNYMLDWIIMTLRKWLMIRRESQAEARV